LTTFQLVTLPLLAAMILATAIQIGRRRLTMRFGLAWLALWIAAAVSIADPDLLVRIAHFLGIGRGADLVLYLSILFTFLAFFITYLRFRRIDEQLTKIVRHLAIRDAEPSRVAAAVGGTTPEAGVATPDQ
jgi:small membrane protein